MSTGTADRDPDSEVERRWSPRLSGSDFGHLDCGGGKGPEGPEPRLGGSPGRILVGGEHWNGVYIVICKMLFHLFFPTSDLGITLGAGE